MSSADGSATHVPTYEQMARVVLSFPYMHHLAVMLLLLLQAPQQPGVKSADLSQAEARYRAAIELNPAVSAYHQSLALVLERQGRLTEALAAHRQSVALDSLAARNRAGYGELLLRIGKAPEAVPQLSAAARLDPTSVEIRKNLAAALNQSGQPQQAASVLREARAIAPDDSSIAQALASIAPSRAPTAGYHDNSDFENDHATGWFVRRVLQTVFTIVLGVAALALVAPILATALLALRLPFERLRRTAS
jgi:tetratricopeptide (TPR) repeat protein